MSRPFHILKHEHRIIERVLRALDGVCVRLGCGGEVPAPALLEIVGFITTFADRYHHGKEEEFLFPALERRGITRAGGPLEVMEYEHQVERDLTAELEQTIALYKEGDEDARAMFIDAARAYMRMLVRHIEQEDSILFRIGDEVLDDAEKISLAASFEQSASALGNRTLQDYERLASELEKRWAV